MAFGFSPKHKEDHSLNGMPGFRAYVIAIEAANKLGWKIGAISKTGFFAYSRFSVSSWSEEIQVKFTEDVMSIKSECMGSQLMDWGKNKKNVHKFIEAFDKLKEEITGDIASSKYSELEKQFVTGEDDVLSQPPLTKKEEVKSFAALFIPSKGYFITPIILLINILIFVLMVANGVHLMEPTTDSLLKWGANFSPATLDGEWWRLITSCFIHIGLIHLLVNMYALMYIGVILEPYIGRTRFLVAYLLTGLVGSTISVYWNTLTVSAGASGAIFGMYGVFLAMLTTRLIEKTARQTLLASIVIFVAYNLMSGLRSNVDNAAHIGGLLSGLLIGYAFYPGLVKSTSMLLKYGVSALVSIVMVLFASFVLANSSNDLAKYDKEMDKFIEFEERAMKVYDMLNKGSYYSNQEKLTQLQDTGIYYWYENIKVLNAINEMDLPGEILARNDKLKQYCELRIKIYETIFKSILEDTDKYMLELDELNTELENLMTSLE